MRTSLLSTGCDAVLHEQTVAGEGTDLQEGEMGRPEDGAARRDRGERQEGP
jgi:hypothetical protein